jgi:hypothetical protein
MKMKKKKLEYLFLRVSNPNNGFLSICFYEAKCKCKKHRTTKKHNNIIIIFFVFIYSNDFIIIKQKYFLYLMTVIDAEFDTEDHGSISATAIERRLEPLDARTRTRLI